MAALEASFSIFTFSSSPSPAHSSSSKPYLFPKPTILSLRIRNSAPGSSLNFPIFPVGNNSRSLISVLCSVVEEKASLVGKTEKTQKPNVKRKLFVFNLPWSLTVKDISELFGQCGTVSDVEIIKQKDGRNRGFAFVTMATGEEAQAAIDKFDSYQVSGRILRVKFAKRFRKPSPRPRLSTSLPASKETRHQLYASNLAWKARSTHLRELFTASDLNPVSARVVFETPEGRAAGYGFVSFATREEAETAISKLNGKELMGRPISLKFSARNKDESEDQDGVKNEISEGKSE